MKHAIIGGIILILGGTILLAGGNPERPDAAKPEPAPIRESVQTEIEASPTERGTVVPFPGPKDMTYQQLTAYYEGFPEYVGQAMQDTLLPPGSRKEDFSYSLPNGTLRISGAHETSYHDEAHTVLETGILAEPAVLTFSGYPATLAAGSRVFLERGPILGNVFMLGEDAVLPGNYHTLKYAAHTPVRMWSEKCVRAGTLAEAQRIKHNLLPAGTKVRFTEEDTLIRPWLVIEGLLAWMKSPEPVRLKGYTYDLLFDEAEFDEKGYIASGRLAEPFSADGMSFAAGEWVEFQVYTYDADNGDSGDPLKMDFLDLADRPYGEPINLAAANEANHRAAEEREAARKAEEAKRPTEFVYEGIRYVGKILFHPNGQFWGGDLAEDSIVRGYRFSGGERVSFNEDGSLNTGILVEPTKIQGLLLFDSVRFYPSGNLREGKIYGSQTVRGRQEQHGARFYFKDGELDQ